MDQIKMHERLVVELQVILAMQQLDGNVFIDALAGYRPVAHWVQDKDRPSQSMANMMAADAWIGSTPGMVRIITGGIPVPDFGSIVGGRVPGGEGPTRWRI